MTFAHYESTHFQFSGLFTDRTTAEKKMLAAARKHSRQYGVRLADWFEADDVNYTEAEVNDVLRDFQEVI